MRVARGGILTLVLVNVALSGMAPAEVKKNSQKETVKMDSAKIYFIPVKTIDGKDTTLGTHAGKAILIVNTASECGYTPQYGPLQKLFETYRDRGFTVAAFPANNFGGQEPGTNAEIAAFCSTKFKVTFPLYAKISVKGKDIHPLYQYLTAGSGFDGDIKWNFNKFLVDSTGKVVARFDSGVDPMSPKLTAAVEAALPGTK